LPAVARVGLRVGLRIELSHGIPLSRVATRYWPEGWYTLFACRLRRSASGLTESPASCPRWRFAFGAKRILAPRVKEN